MKFGRYSYSTSAQGYQVQEKTCTLSKMAFSGRHYNHSCWLLTQKYNSVLKDYRENTAWIALFHTKDKNSFDQAHDENDVVPDGEREGIKKHLRDVKYSKLMIDTEPPVSHRVSYKIEKIIYIYSKNSNMLQTNL